jgi:hypothetical protein
METEEAAGGAPRGRPARYPAIARACLHLDWIFLVLWAFYLAGPDALAIGGPGRLGISYALFTGLFFVFHFILMSTGIIALFVVIIEIHAQRPVRGFRSVLVALGLPILSFLYFAARYLAQVESWLRR